MAADTELTPLASRLLTRVLDRRKPFDYLWLALFAAFPIGLAAAFNAEHLPNGFAGYYERYNWMLLVLLLPMAAFALRWITNRIAPVSSRELPASMPPLIELVDSDAGKHKAYAALRKALLSPKVFHVALLVTTLFHIADMAQLAGFYLSGADIICPSEPAEGDPKNESCVREVDKEEKENEGTVGLLQVRLAGIDFEVEKDWAVAYLSDDKVSKWKNLVLVLCAYAVQFALIFIGFLLIVFILRHNLFFLSRIYQRRRVTPGEEASYIHIDLDDKEKCFGFRPSNNAFNIQVLALAIAAIVILVTRFANVRPGTGLFPDVGQWAAVLSWLVALGIVSLPILVKLLPRLPMRKAKKPPNTLVGYLREFISDEEWVISDDTPHDEIDAVAARFAENAFWPTGNNRAWQLYFLAFWVFFVAVVPDARAIVMFKSPSIWPMIAGWAVSGVLAWGATSALFAILRALLTYIDRRLVEPPAQPIGDGTNKRRRKIPIGVFISYRRDDSAAYTGRLYDSLASRIDRDKLFMDLDKIPGGVDFVEEMKMAIDSARAMIVVIGPQWLTISGGDGPARIQDPTDFVHLELALGLARNLRVFPVLVGGAAMPSEADLPERLKTLAALNAREITDSRWAHDVGLLLEDLEVVGSENRKNQKTMNVMR